MNRLQFVLSSRGVGNIVARSKTVSSRFGLGPGKMARCFERYMDVLDRYRVRPSFPITALPMSRNMGPVRALLDRGAELAVHAYTHVDLTALDFDRQRGNLERANEKFRALGVPFSGFRAPYLHWNEDTLRCVDELGYLYSSNEVLLWDVYREGELSPEQEEAYRRAAAFYTPESAAVRPSLPYLRGTHVEIPVSLPDDEIPVDRLAILDGREIATTWLRIYEAVKDREELFTLQLHPERIFICQGGLEAVLERVRSDGNVWVATMEEIARWWKDRSTLRFELDSSPDGDAFVRVTGPAGVTLWGNEDGGEWKRAEGPIRLRAGSPVPMVGVGHGSDPEALSFLRQDGYWVEELSEDAPCAVHLGKVEAFRREDARGWIERIGAAPGKVVRAGRWPNGAMTALCVTGDIDCLTLGDFALRWLGR